MAVLTAVAPSGGVAVLTAVAPGGGVRVLVAAGVAVAPAPGRVGVGVSVGTVWKSGAWAGNAHAPGMVANKPNTNSPATAKAMARGKSKRLLDGSLVRGRIRYCPIPGRC